jgi:hypothetical protein
MAESYRYRVRDALLNERGGGKPWARLPEMSQRPPDLSG